MHLQVWHGDASWEPEAANSAHAEELATTSLPLCPEHVLVHPCHHLLLSYGECSLGQDYGSVHLELEDFLMFLVSYLDTVTFFDMRCLCAELCDVLELISWLVGSLVCESCLDQICCVH